MSVESRSFEVYTDGSVIGSGRGAGAYAAVIRDASGETRTITGVEQNVGIGRMELMAVVVALESFEMPVRVTVNTDAEYIAKSVNAGWLSGWIRRGYRTSSGRDVASKDLWARYVEQDLRHEITVRHVRGHSGNELNEIAHTRAYEKAMELHESLAAGEMLEPGVSGEPEVEHEKSLFDYHVRLRDAAAPAPAPVAGSDDRQEIGEMPFGEEAEALEAGGWVYRVRGPKNLRIWCEDENDWRKRWVSEGVAFQRLTERLEEETERGSRGDESEFGSVRGAAYGGSVARLSDWRR